MNCSALNPPRVGEELEPVDDELSWRAVQELLASLDAEEQEAVVVVPVLHTSPTKGYL